MDPIQRRIMLAITSAISLAITIWGFVTHNDLRIVVGMLLLGYYAGYYFMTRKMK